MDVDVREVTALDEALALAPALDERAAEFLSEFSDEAFPRGASRRFLERDLGDPATVLLRAAVGDSGAFCGLCLVGPRVDPLLGTRTPTVLVLHVESAWRHRGVARALVERASRILAARGQPALTARVGYNNDALISMGERWGFLRVWEEMVRE